MLERMDKMARRDIKEEEVQILPEEQVAVSVVWVVRQTRAEPVEMALVVVAAQLKDVEAHTAAAQGVLLRLLSLTQAVEAVEEEDTVVEVEAPILVETAQEEQEAVQV